MAPTKKPSRTTAEAAADCDTDIPGVRVLALRKERSRDAARSRRSRENVQYLELAKLLPLPSAITSQLDKASVIRLTISYLKFRSLDMGAKLKRENNGESQLLPVMGSALSSAVMEKDAGIHVLQALDGFLFAVSGSGKFLYVSETVSTYLGLSQVELIGSSIFSYIHEDDQVQFSKLLNDALGEEEDDEVEADSSGDAGAEGPKPPRTIKSFIRMKCALVKRGGSYTKTMGYKVIQLLGRVVPYKAKVPGEKCQRSLVAVGNPLPLPTVCELRVQSHAFISRVGLDLKIVFCEGGINRFMDFRARDIVGLSAYEFYHLDDMGSIQVAHNQCVKAGQTVTSAYRWMNKNGGWVWMLTHATIIKRNGEDGTEEFQILCVNHVISDIEHKGVVMHGIQSYFANKREGLTGIGVDFEDCELSSEKRKTTFPLDEPPHPAIREDSLIDDLFSDTSLNDDDFPSPLLFENEESESGMAFDFKVPVNNNVENKASAAPKGVNEADPLAGDLLSSVGLSEADRRCANNSSTEDTGKLDLAGSGGDGTYWNNLFGEDTTLVEELMAELQRVEDESYGAVPKYEGFSSCQQSRIPQPLPLPSNPGTSTGLPQRPYMRPTSTITRSQATDTSGGQSRVINTQGQFTEYQNRMNHIPYNNGPLPSQGSPQGMMSSIPNGNVVVNGDGLISNNRLNGFGTGNELRQQQGLSGHQILTNGQIKTNGLSDNESTLFNARFNDLTLRNSINFAPVHPQQQRSDYLPQVRELKTISQLPGLGDYPVAPDPLMALPNKAPPPYQDIMASQVPPPLRHFSYSPTVNWISP